MLECVHACVCMCEWVCACVRVHGMSPQNTRSVSSVVVNVFDAQPVLSLALITANPSTASELTNGSFPIQKSLA